MIDVKETVDVIKEMAEMVRDYETRIATIDDDSYEIIGKQLHLNTECLSDDGLDSIIDAIRNAYVEIRDTSIATIAEQSALLSQATGAVSHKTGNLDLLHYAIAQECEQTASVSGVYDIVKKHSGRYSAVEFVDGYCKGCETTTPAIKGINECLVCGTTHGFDS